MNRNDITELYYIAPIVNVPSIMKHGILSHKLSQQIIHNSIAMPEIQERRQNKHIPGARRLHEYSNLYFDAHNPMLSKIRAQNDEICILRIDANVLELPGVIITDQNSASKWVRFFPVADGLKALDQNRIYARYWIHPEDPFDDGHHKLEKCAEVLVPDRVEARFILGVYVANEAALSRFQKFDIDLPVGIKSDIFFQREQ